MEILAGLKNIGLNEKEARIYVSLLQLGKSTAYSIAKHSNLKKPTTYVILEELIDKGIVSRIPRAKTMQFVAISPTELFSVAKSKLETAEKETLPELKAMNRGKEYKVKISAYEGVSGIQEMYKQIIEEVKSAPRNKRSYVGFYAHAQNTPPELQKFFDKLMERFGKEMIKRKGITVADKTTQVFLDKEYQRKNHVELKGIKPNKYNSDISIEVFRSKTYIFSHKHIQGTVIDNPDVAKVMKQIFELVWEREDGIFEN